MPRYILDPKTGERTLVQPASTFAPICQQLNEQRAALSTTTEPTDESTDEAGNEDAD